MDGKVVVCVVSMCAVLLVGCQSSSPKKESACLDDCTLHFKKNETHEKIIQEKEKPKASTPKKITKTTLQNEIPPVVKEKKKVRKQKIPLPQRAVSVEQKSADMVAKLIVYFINAQRFSKLSLNNELTVMESKYKKDTDPVTRIKLAYLLSLSKWNTSNAKKIASLLNGIRQNSDVHANYKALADFLTSYINTQNDLQFRLGVERKQNKELLKQLDALTDIEMKINEREPIPNAGIEEPDL